MRIRVSARALVVLLLGLVLLAASLVPPERPSAAGGVQAQGTVSFVKRWFGQVTNTGGNPKQVSTTTPGIGSGFGLAFGTACFFPIGPSIGTTLGISGGPSWSLLTNISFHDSNVDCLIYSWFAAGFSPGATVSVAWSTSPFFNVSFAGVAVLLYSGVDHIGGFNNTKGFVPGPANPPIKVNLTISGANAWLAGFSQDVNECGGATTQHPVIQSSGAFQSPRLWFNNETVFNECWAAGDSNQGYIVGSKQWLGWEGFQPGYYNLAIVLELVPPVIASTPWVNPTTNTSSPGFYSWLPPMLFVVGLSIMVGAVVMAGINVFRRL